MNYKKDIINITNNTINYIRFLKDLLNILVFEIPWIIYTYNDGVPITPSTIYSGFDHTPGFHETSFHCWVVFVWVRLSSFRLGF